MKETRTSRAKYLQIATIAVALTFGVRTYAETPRDELVHAYRLLKSANSDYQGHRMNALNEVEAASKDLGLELHGDVNLQNRERQWKSDQQLSEARKLLRDSRKKLEARDRDRVASHVESAIKEIDSALRVK